MPRPNSIAGWVAYAVSAVVSAAGENKLMPSPDASCIVINGENGYTRSNTSWVIGRLIRDYDSWMHEKIREKQQEVIANKKKENEEKRLKKLNQAKEIKSGIPTTNDASPNKTTSVTTTPDIKIAGLCVSVYKSTGTAGSPTRDTIFWSGLVVAVLQLGVASIPCGLYGDWGVLLITACGIILAFLTGSLPQWKAEKWVGRQNSKKKIVMTRGAGSQHAIIVLGEGVGIDLEDLAGVENNTDVSTTPYTRIAITVLAAFWILLLITAAALDQNNWFLMLVGGIGIVQNMVVAGAKRTPDAMGIPLKFDSVFGETKVMRTLFAVEEKHPGVGFNMVATFFPGGDLLYAEKERWHQFNSEYFPDFTPSSTEAT